MTCAHQRFRLLDVLLSEEKLPIQVAEIDGVQIDDVDVAESGQDEVLEQLAADPSGADQQDACLGELELCG